LFYILWLLHFRVWVNLTLQLIMPKKLLRLNQKFTQADMLISQSMKYEAGNLHYDEMNLKINNLTLNDEQKN